MAGQAPFVIQPYLTSIALAYKNEKMIADDVLPRVPVDRSVFKYTSYNKADTFTVPNTRVGRLSKTNQVDWSATESTSSTADWGLEEPIPNSDILNAEGIPNTPVDPRATATEQLVDLVALDREVRVANLVFNSASYAAGCTQSLTSNGSGGTKYQWNDTTNGDPVYDILTAMDTMLIRPNILVIGRAVYTALRKHPKVIAAVFQTMGGNAATGGVTSKQAIADLFELDEVIVGEGWVNTAKKGQTPSMTRVWGKYAALLYRNPLATQKNTVTFGVTFQFGQRIAGTIDNDPDIGLRGGTRVRVGESVKELVIANDTGYLFTTAVA